ESNKGSLNSSFATLERALASIEGRESRREDRFPTGARVESLVRLTGELVQLLQLLQGADVAPTTQAIAACADVRQTLDALKTQWNEIKKKEVKEMNKSLREQNLPELTVEP